MEVDRRVTFKESPGAELFTLELKLPFNLTGTATKGR